MSKDRSITIRSAQELGKTRRSSKLVDKHLSRLESEASDLSNTATIEYHGGTYRGEIENGVPHGGGLWEHPDGRAYEGEWHEGDFGIKGSYTEPYGSDFSAWETGMTSVDNAKLSIRTMSLFWFDFFYDLGTWNYALSEEDRKNLQGKETKYVGSWSTLQQPAPEGIGTVFLPDGSTYTGDIKRGQISGLGTVTYSNGDMYDGKWQDDLWGGGTIHLANGETLKDSPRGTIRFFTGTYTGELKNALPHGQGYWSNRDGVSYIGKWSDGKLSGEGIYKYPAACHTGWIELDQWELGEVVSNDQMYEYIGEFKNSQLFGRGVLKCPSGLNLEGDWRGIEGIWNGTGYDQDGNIEVKFFEGVAQKISK